MSVIPTEARAMNAVSRPFNVGLIQMRCSDDPEDNLRRASIFLRSAAGQGVQVACLPELFRTRYFCQSEDSARFELAEPIPGPTTEALAQVARDTKMVVVGSIFERRAAGIYHNSAVVLDSDGAIKGTYRKMHIPDDPLYYEKYYFTPGDLGFRSFDTSFARVGTLICWDQWYPEAARLTALQDAEILFYPTAKPFSGRTRSPTVFSSRPSIGSATKVPLMAAWNSGAARSWRTHSAG
jgi:N-carbamoylputrescine amidase